MLTAHLRQARTVLRRVGETEQLWVQIERIVARRGLAERTVPLLLDAAQGLRVRNAVYRAMSEEEISDAVASRDLRNLVNEGLLVPHGEKRGRYYRASEELRDLRRRIMQLRNPRDETDPFGPPAGASNR